MDKLNTFLLDKKTQENLQAIESFSGSETIPFKLLEASINDNGEDHVILGNNVLRDVEMFVSFDGSQEDNILNTICKPFLKGSVPFMTEILRVPTNDRNILLKRQYLVDTIASKQVYEKLKILKEHENVLYWMYSPDRAESFEQIYEMVYFTSFITKFLNDNGSALSALNAYKIAISPVIGFFTPIAYFIVPYLVLLYKFKVPLSFFDYIKMSYQGLCAATSAMSNISTLSYIISMFFYFQGMFNTIEISKAVNRICKVLTNKMNSLMTFINVAEDLYTSVWDNPSYTYAFPFVSDSESNYKPLSEFKDIPIDSEYSVISIENIKWFGTKLKHYKFFKKAEYLQLFQKVFIIDCVYTISCIKRDRQFCFPNFMKDKEGSKPHFDFKQLWHPSLNKTIVKNDVYADKNWIITGPNAGGKSTLIKSILLSILFAQTIGIAPCKYMKFAPLKYINSQINVPDCKGKESLFEAEMFRSKMNLDMLKSGSIKGLSVLFMDEIFNSTNPIEGIAGAWAIAKSISDYPSNLMFITTHFVYLTKLSKEYPDRFQNKKMEVIVSNTSQISFPYILQNGCSRQYIALELLNTNGFDKDIIDEALIIKNRLCSKPKKESLSNS